MTLKSLPFTLEDSKPASATHSLTALHAGGQLTRIWYPLPH